MRHYEITVALALAALALAGCGRKEAADPAGGAAAVVPVAVETAKAVVRPVETTVTAQGTLAPGQGSSAKISAVAAGRIASISVREGDRVAAGQVVATLDNRYTAAQAAQAQYSARAAASDQAGTLGAARLALDSARIDRANALEQARTSLQSAETDMAKARAGSRPQEIALADQAVRQAQATRDRAATELDRVRFLNDRGIAARRQLDDAQTALSVAESGLESAKAQANLVRAGTRPEDLRAAELKVKSAREALAQARTSGDAHVRQAAAALRLAEGGALGVAAKRQEAISMRTAAGYAVLRSPVTGIVIRRSANPGDMADLASPILEVAETRSLNLLASIPAEQGASVRPSEIVRVDAGGQVAAGRVLSVGTVDPQTNLLAVRIAVSNPGGTLKPGAFATARIVVHTDPRGLVVPIQAVLSREGKSVAFTVSPDGTAHQRTVTLGPEQDGFVEVHTGLKAGETVIRLGQYELTDGAKVRAAGEGGS